jgi:hypothetical protein
MKLEERKLAVAQIRLDLYRMSKLVDIAFKYSPVTELEVTSMIQLSETMLNQSKALLKQMREIKA